MDILYPNIPWALRWEAIKRALQDANTSLERIARETGVTAPAMVKTKHYPSGQQAIADALGVAPETLFPERYKTVWSDHHQQQINRVMGPLLGLSVGESQSQFRDTIEAWSSHPVDVSTMPTEAKAKWAWIKDHLKKRGLGIKQLANELSLRRSAIYNLAHHAYKKPQTLIAKCLGVAPRLIWPDRYNADGTPLKARGGNPAFATQRIIDPRHMLDLVEGLWLPIKTIEGLPGIASRKEYVSTQAERENWNLREREGLIEVAFESLPNLTKLHLTRGWTPKALETSAPDVAQSGSPLYRSVELSRDPPTDRHFVLRMATFGPNTLAELSLTCLRSSTGEVLNGLTSVVSANSLSELSRILNDASGLVDR
ncbi:hypothetical protein BLL42_27530 (plasmid) [Pseudomonas frederiksbergensis]|uniref:Ner winged helix-turn-helix DNA-binding domain-containing protein n=1 Tax=Pseudomonas frederiksbergensis TaxID=104087 RepID=A0A1J0ETQ6_9PSED|nr:helix-turn-helix domain-containing protein [Pseudomonas frederiksbergensis]APC19489.1 hypothetical protein BLL42_27530 [Pseudomonas frederiksbergensis]